MAKAWAKAFYKSKAWQDCRDLYLSQHCLCERCLKRGYIVPAKIVHHKIWLDERSIKDPSIALCTDNLEALCQDCHTKEHHCEAADRRWQFNSAGELEISNNIPPLCSKNKKEA